MKYEIEGSKVKEFLAEVNELDELLTERISELHEVQGMQQCRHAYIFYRERLWTARDAIKDSIKEVKEKTKK
jgi:hypothetical protein